VDETKLTPANYCNSTLWKPSNQSETWKPLSGYSKCLLPGQSNHTNNPYGQWIQNKGFNDSATYNCLVRTDENPFATTNLEKKWMGNQTCDKGDAKHRRCLGQQSKKCVQAECKFLTAISHRGLRNDFFFEVASRFHILFGLLFPFSIWTFNSLFYLDI
jgi:hypothetical protein